MEKAKQIDDNEVANNGDGPNGRGGSSSNDEFYPGYRFYPTDIELLIFYLKNKILDKPIRNDRIRDANIYNYNPKQLFETYGLDREEEWYFYCRRDRKYPKGSTPNRAAGNGFWKGSKSATPILSRNKTIGYKRPMAYYEGNPKTRWKTNWRMYEYTLGQPQKKTTTKTATTTTTTTTTTAAIAAAADMKLDDWVLCKIYHGIPKRGGIFRKNRHLQDDDEDEVLPINNADDHHHHHQQQQQQPHYLVQAPPLLAPPPLPPGRMYNNMYDPAGLPASSSSGSNYAYDYNGVHVAGHEDVVLPYGWYDHVDDLTYLHGHVHDHGFVPNPLHGYPNELRNSVFGDEMHDMEIDAILDDFHKKLGGTDH